MTNKHIYDIIVQLGMIDETDLTESDLNLFENTSNKDLVKIMNFVDQLVTYNDLDTIKKLLVAILALNITEVKQND